MISVALWHVAHRAGVAGVWQGTRLLLRVATGEICRRDAASGRLGQKYDRLYDDNYHQSPASRVVSVRQVRRDGSAPAPAP